MPETRYYCRDVRVDNETPAEASIRGVAAVFYDGTPETEFQLNERIVERIMPGAFDGFEEQDVVAVRNHDFNQLLGRTSSGTLQLSVTDRGLEYRITPSDTQIYRDTLTDINRGDIDGSSFQFGIPEDGEEWIKDGKRTVRQITRVDPLVDIGPVVFPAYHASQVSVRSLEVRCGLRDPEPVVRDYEAETQRVRERARKLAAECGIDF